MAPISVKYDRRFRSQLIEKTSFLINNLLVTHPSKKYALCHLYVVNLRFYLKAKLLKKSRLLKNNLATRNSFRPAFLFSFLSFELQI